MGFAGTKYNLPMADVGIGLSRNDLLIPPTIMENIRNCNIHELGLGKRGGSAILDNISGNPRITGLKQFISAQGDRYILRATEDGKLYKDNTNTIKTGLSTRGDEALAEGDFATHAKWTTSGDFNDTGGNLVYAHVTGSGGTGQAASDFKIPLKGNTLYEFSYTVSGVAGDPSGNITGGALNVVADDVALTISNGAQTTQFTTVSDITGKGFGLDGASDDGADTFTLDDISLKEVIAPPVDITDYQDMAIFTNRHDVPQAWDGLRFLKAPVACIAGNANLGGGNLDNAALYSYKVTFTNAAGETDGSPATWDVKISGSAVDGQIRLTSIPIGPEEVTSRKIYRTEGGGSIYKLLTTLSDNTTTTYIDNIADGSLGATIPGDNTAATASATTDLGGEGIDPPGAPTTTLKGPLALTAERAGVAGNVDDGTHSYIVVFVDEDGVNSAPGTESNQINITAKAVDGQVSLSNIPIGPTGTVSREIYRTKAGDAGEHLLLAIINDNTTTSATDNTADADLVNVISEGDFTTNNDWNETGDLVINLGVAGYSHVTGSGNIQQTSNAFANAIENSQKYLFTYTVSNVTNPSNIDAFFILGGASLIIDSQEDLDKTAGTHTIVLTTSSDAETKTFYIGLVSSAGCTLDIDDIQLTKMVEDEAAIGAGVYSYKITNINVHGETTGGTASDDITTTTENGRVEISDIPIGPLGTIARGIYRTAVGGSQYKLLAIIPDNTTTTWTDIILDAILGVNIPTSNTAAARPSSWIGTNQPQYALNYSAGNTEGIMFYGFSDTKDQIFLSADGSFDFSDEKIIQFIINTGGEESGIVGAIEYANRPIIFTKNKAWIILKDDVSTANWTYVKAPWNGGTINNKTLVKVLDDVYSMAQDGNIYRISTVTDYGDYKTRSLTRATGNKQFDFNRWIQQNVDFDYAEDFHAEYNSELRAVFFWVVRTGQTEVDTALVYFIDHDRWLLHDNRDYNSGHSASVSTVVENVDGTETVYTGDYGGNVWKLDQSARNDNSNGYWAGFKTNRMIIPTEQKNIIDKRIYQEFFGIYEEIASQDYEVDAWIDGVQVGAGQIDMTNNYNNFINKLQGRDIQVEMYNNTANEDFFLMALVFFVEMLE
jgi:hypothetical protein